MVTRLFCYLYISAFMLVSCSKDLDCMTTDNGADKFVAFSFSVPETRSMTDEDGSGKFTDGDRIGLYVNGKLHILTQENGTWKPKLKRSEIEEGKYISAYYPCPEGTQEGDFADNRHLHKVETDQSGDGYAHSDLLWAHLDIEPGNLGETINMTFKHAMHKLDITVTVPENTTPEELSVSVLNRAEGYIPLDSDTPQESADALVRITPHRQEGTDPGNFSAILFPSALSHYGDAWIEISAGGKTAVFKAPETIGGNRSLLPGKSTLLNLRLTQNEIEPNPDKEFTDTVCWVYGVAAPDYPFHNEESVPIVGLDLSVFPKSGWFQPGDYAEQYLNWNAEYKWYDADKRNPDKTHPEFGQDNLLCWAASASNILHWWMENNSHYIELYEKKYGTDSKYSRPSYKFEGKSSEIFNFFRRHCINRGGEPDKGVNWILYGNSENIGLTDYNMYDDFKGYFNKIFNDGNKLTTVTRSIRKENFNSVIKNAFLNNQALAFATYSESSGIMHAMTIWGAEFDETGNVSAIYYVDNNDYYEFEIIGDHTEYQRHRIIRGKIIYTDSEVCLEKTSKTIPYLMTMSLGRNIWEAEFGKIQ